MKSPGYYSNDELLRKNVSFWHNTHKHTLSGRFPTHKPPKWPFQFIYHMYNSPYIPMPVSRTLKASCNEWISLVSKCINHLNNFITCKSACESMKNQDLSLHIYHFQPNEAFPIMTGAIHTIFQGLPHSSLYFCSISQFTSPLHDP